MPEGCGVGRGVLAAGSHGAGGGGGGGGCLERSGTGRRGGEEMDAGRADVGDRAWRTEGEGWGAVGARVGWGGNGMGMEWDGMG